MPEAPETLVSIRMQLLVDSEADASRWEDPVTSLAVRLASPIGEGDVLAMQVRMRPCVSLLLCMLRACRHCQELVDFANGKPGATRVRSLDAPREEEEIEEAARRQSEETQMPLNMPLKAIGPVEKTGGFVV